MRDKILKNISWLLFDKIIRVFGGLFIGIWIARHLGPEMFGQLNFSIAYVFMFSFIANLGLNQITVREIKKGNFPVNKIIGTTFFLKVAGGLLSIVFIMTSLLIVDLDKSVYVLILIIMMRYAFQSMDVIDYFFQSMVLSKYVVIARNSSYMITASLNIFFIINDYSVSWFAIALIMDFFLASWFMVIIYQRNGYTLRSWSFDKKIMTLLLRDSWPLMLGSFLVAVQMRVDQLMIGYYLSEKEVGIYSAAATISEAWYFFPIILTSTLMPYFVEIRENDRHYHSRLKQLYSLMFWMGSGVGIVVFFWGNEIIELLFGKPYADAYYPLVYMIWCGIFVSQSVTQGIWMINENLQKYRLYTGVIGLFINVAGNFFFIPTYGIAGAAATTLFAAFMRVWVISLLWRPIRASTINLIKSINPICLIKG